VKQTKEDGLQREKFGFGPAVLVRPYRLESVRAFFSPDILQKSKSTLIYSRPLGVYAYPESRR